VRYGPAQKQAQCQRGQEAPVKARGQGRARPQGHHEGHTVWARSGSRIRKKVFASQPPTPKDISFKSGHCGFTCSWRSEHTKKLCRYVAAHEPNVLCGRNISTRCHTESATAKAEGNADCPDPAVSFTWPLPKDPPHSRNTHCHLSRRKEIGKSTHT